MSVIMDDTEWFSEKLHDRTAFSVRYTSKLYDEMSDFQRIEIFETETMGRVLVLGGCFMVTQKDSFIYHEMLVHPVMMVAGNVKNALVIGGGDGGTVTEIVKHPGVESVTLCEIDPMVVSACSEFFPDISAGLSDPRVTVVNDDGAAFIRNRKGQFDAIFVDSTDPVGPGKALFEVSFYESIRDGLRAGGAASFQTESPLFMEDVFAMSVSDLKGTFGKQNAVPYLATVPSYPGGLWSFTFCSVSRDPLRDAPAELPAATRDHLRYYDYAVHRAAFALPVFVRKLLEPKK
jgi:spermidine synthase